MDIDEFIESCEIKEELRTFYELITLGKEDDIEGYINKLDMDDADDKDLLLNIYTYSTDRNVRFAACQKLFYGKKEVRLPRRGR